MHITEKLASIVAAAALLAPAGVPAAAQVSSSPAALVIFPEILVDGVRGIDTVIQLGNAADGAVEVRCVYEDLTPDCVGTGSCVPDQGSCDGPCVRRGVTVPFRIRLTSNQPLGWSAAEGLTVPPLDGEELRGVDGENNAGTRIPSLTSSVSAGLFQGTLRCVAVDPHGRPAERNVLVGSASIETSSTVHAARVDAAQYDAIGLAAVTGANDNDEILRLGGAQPEYASCPGSLVLPHLFDGAVGLAAGTASAALTTVALVPCGGDVVGASPAEAVVQMLVHNELAQRFSTSIRIEGQIVTQLSRIDTSLPTRSIFSVGVNGTLTGQTDFQSVQGGIVGVAVEARESSADPSQIQHAAVRLASEGTLLAPDLVALVQPPCSGDCNGDGQVTMDELVLSINIALDQAPVDACLAVDGDDSGTARIDEIARAVGVALTSCPARVLPTTPPESVETPAPTPTPPTVPGPAITFLGIASGDDAPQQPMGADDQGRPFYTWPVGQGFSLIVEARPGSTGSPVGVQAAAASDDLLPDLQMIVSRPLGDGNPVVCDADPPTLGGVPAVVPFEFSAAPDVVHAINDLGCRTDDGVGEPRGRSEGRPCTRIPPTNDPAFVSASSRGVQFCLPIARAWAFPEGDTTVAVRVRDVEGTIGPVREMVIRVPAGP